MIIYRYLTKEICTVFLATTLILLLVFVSNQFVRYLQTAAAGEVASHVVVLLLLLQVPNLLVIVLPASLFVSILIAYGRLYADNEMTILAACGVSPAEILKKTMFFALGVTFVVAVLSLWAAPKIARFADRIFAQSAASSLELLIPNRFQSFNRGAWVYYVDKASRDKTKLQRIFAAQQPGELGGKQKAWSVVFAKGGHKKQDAHGNTFLVLTNGYRYTGVPGQRDYQITKYDQYGIHLQQMMDEWQPDEGNAPTLLLWKKRNDPHAMAELQWRISLPISVLILALLSVPLSRVKPKRGRYAKLLPAILFYVAYAQLLFLSRAWLKKDLLAPFIGMWWVHVVMLIMALFLLKSQLGFSNIWNKSHANHS